MRNRSIWLVFEETVACSQTVLPDRSILIGQKLVENAKTHKQSVYIKKSIFAESITDGVFVTNQSL